MKFIIIFLFCISAYGQNQIRFNTGRNIPVVLMYVNGLFGEFIIDTGATDNYIDSTIRKKYGYYLSSFGMDDSVVLGGGGYKRAYVAENVRIVHNDTMVNIKFKSINLWHIRKNKGVIGIIGSKWLNENKYVIDYKRKILWRKK